ncbi:MAG: aminotransferase class I/II-fold pyridoxal phosphate-dependent enzyme [Caldilineae bacterium]|nr:aminotransferase class I/II-fold pyridoxal phosphate-dependent enzyme [Anaerolineae bacterium]MCB0203513.1 aminotransferase class I/II-fold pyridoxal phosphate-dependent enzyme [Anaerolineae bacterium]MCB9153272.1 aminotransferase class I/II-fold pyridoxal phosphate-dependent enzyme [Caldilineae bacterium]
MTKQFVTDLAVFGGPPAFTEVLHVGRPNIGDRDRLLARIDEMLDRRWLTNHGPFVAELEAKLAAFLGVKHVIAMCNGTVALEIAARALGLNGEVIVPAFTFVATAHALQWQEITPVFCDVDPQTHLLDPARVEAMITPRTSGIVGVHLWGQPCNVDALAEIAQRRGLRLLYDAAHAFACSRDQRMIGNFGDAEVFSFHATKFFNTFEGGAVATNDDDLAQRIRLMQNFGFTGLDTVVYIGVNGKMSEVSAAMGLTGLEGLDTFVAANRRNYDCYAAALAGVPGLRMLRYDRQEHQNYQYIVLEVDEAAGISRDVLVRVLHAENVRARRYFYPGVHRMEPYRSYFPHAGLLLPVTERLAGQVLVLPTGTAVSPDDIAQIAQLIAFAVANGPAISRELNRLEKSAA